MGRGNMANCSVFWRRPWAIQELLRVSLWPGSSSAQRVGGRCGRAAGESDWRPAMLAVPFDRPCFIDPRDGVGKKVKRGMAIRRQLSAIWAPARPPRIIQTLRHLPLERPALGAVVSFRVAVSTECNPAESTALTMAKQYLGTKAIRPRAPCF